MFIAIHTDQRKTTTMAMCMAIYMSVSDRGLGGE
jgi:hypothetical protein